MKGKTFYALITAMALMATVLALAPMDATGLPETNVVNGSDYEVVYGASVEVPYTQTFIVGWEYHEVFIGYGDDPQEALPGMTVVSDSGRMYASGTPTEAAETLIDFLDANGSHAYMFLSAIDYEDAYGTDPTWAGSALVYIVTGETYELNIGVFSASDVQSMTVPEGMTIQTENVSAGVDVTLCGSPLHTERCTMTSSVTGLSYMVIVNSDVSFGDDAVLAENIYVWPSWASGASIWKGKTASGNCYAWTGTKTYGSGNTASNHLVNATSSNPNICSVEVVDAASLASTNVKLTGVSTGTCTITLTARDGGGAQAQFSVTVKESVTITYVPNAFGDQEVRTVEKGASYNLWGASHWEGNWYLNGFTLTGYNTNGNGTGTAYAFEQTITPNSDLQLVGIWEPNTYTITFNTNGGSSVPSTTIKYQQYYNQAAGWPTTAPTKTHYTFAGWYANSNFSGSAITGTEMYTNQGDTTLYAKWEPVPQYTVTFMRQGTDVPLASEQVYSGESISQYLNGAPCTGYTFVKWVDGEGFRVDQNYPIRANLTIYGVYTANTYTVSFVSNVTGYNINPVTVTYNSTYGANSNWPSSMTYQGHSFIGWYRDANLTGSPVTPDMTVDITSDITLYAKWSDNPVYTVTYVMEGTTIPIATEYVEEGSAISVYALGKTLEGYTFFKWKLGENDYIVSTPVTQNITLAGVYVANTYTVTFDMMGGTPQIAPITVTYGQTYASADGWPTTNPTKDGFLFDGWYLGSTKVRGLDTVSISENMQLHAKWAQAPDDDDKPMPDPEGGDGQQKTDSNDKTAFYIVAAIGAVAIICILVVPRLKV